MSRKNLVMLLVGGSGTGKTTIVKSLEEKGHIHRAITCTTRAPRSGEKNSVDYIFLDNKEELFSMHKNNELIETPTEFGGNWYGCPLKSIYNDIPTIAIIEFDGLNKALDVLKNKSDLIIAPIFLEPLNESDFLNRLKNRGSEKEDTLVRLAERKKEASWGDSDAYSLRIKQDVDMNVADSVKKSSDEILKLIGSFKNKQSLSKKIKMS